MNKAEMLDEVVRLALHIGEREYIVEVDLHEGMDESLEEIEKDIDDSRKQLDHLLNQLKGVR